MPNLFNDVQDAVENIPEVMERHTSIVAASGGEFRRIYEQGRHVRSTCKR